MSSKAVQQPVPRPPISPEDFVAEAQRMTNERDVDAARSVFAPTAEWRTTIDGMVISARGVDEIVARWRVICRFMAARNLLVTKTLVTADDDTIVNEWTGGLGGRTTAHGIEVWKFDEAGLVTSQRLYGFLNTGSDTSAVQSMRMLLAYPLTAATFARIRLTGRRSA
jgi:nuclear transport factor 2 (NTF2) superfamily protein